MARSGEPRSWMAEVRLGAVWRVLVRSGLSRVGCGPARCGPARCGEVWCECGGVGLGGVEHGLGRLGLDWHGMVRS